MIPFAQLTPATLIPEACPFTLTVLDRTDGKIRLSVEIPEGNAPLIHDAAACDACVTGTGEHEPDERDYSSAVWPSDERIAAEAARQVGHLVKVSFFDGADGRLDEVIYHAEPVACLGNTFGVDGELQAALDGLTVRDSDGREVESYAACLLAVEADLAGAAIGLRVEWSTGPRPWSRERVARYLDGLDPEERRELYDAALRPPCQAPATEHVEIEGVEIALCAAHAAEVRAAE